MKRRCLHMLLPCALVVLSWPSGAQATTLSGTRIVRPGQVARLRAVPSVPAACSLRLGGHLLASTGSPVKVASWSWLVPRLRTLTWHLRVSCGHGQEDTFPMRVRGPADAPGRAHLSVSESATPPAKTPPAEAEGGSQGGSPACTDDWICPPPAAPSMPATDTVFSLSVGSCSDWAGYKRPDIYFDQSASDPLAQEGDWQGWTWAEHAEREGISVGPTPQAGGLAVWGPGAGQTGPDGHVAYVEGVSGGEVTLSEMNAPFDPQEEQTPEGYTYYERTAALSTLASEGVRFVAA